MFENHASALKAWWEISHEHQLDVLTFDEHTDTHPPLWTYCNFVLKGNEKALIDYLKKLKDDLSSLVIDALYKKTDKYSGNFHSILKHDEHIATAIYLNIIKKAYICSSQTSDPTCLISEDELKQLYESIIFLKNPFRRMNHPSTFEQCSYFNDFVELQYKYSVNFNNETIDEVVKQIPSDCNFILDIDLDYFQSPFILDTKYNELESFCTLIKKAKAITIATETKYVQDQVQKYELIISKIDNNCQKLNCSNPFRNNWDSRQLLKYVLGLIEYVLSGQWQHEYEINKRIIDEWNRISRSESSQSLINLSS